ncbi:sigma-70 family RNA polymerase sigma factor [Oryzihumus leptocrescens]|uniref:RNA polymerase sigma-B factor n=1 Tax=Oryzihumus leptocrescens TaxID=297536 RepID=A0A542Z9W4_9MICO|nr:sigma-70 family RNA polymerase sigma factor [Oryzihumus leptocrescens]TQL57138.1 RNA polymerase sigma-B factor [Oryzihumus leptocrescens]
MTSQAAAPPPAAEDPPTRDDSPTRNDQTLELLEQAALAECPEVRSRLLDEAFLLNIGTAENIASRYRGRGVDWEDLLQVAYVGLVKAVRGFRPSEGSSFAAYANPTISGEIKRHFRDFAWTVRPPRRIQELQGAVHGVEPELVQALGRPVSPSDLARALAVDLIELREALTVDGCFAPLSLDAPARAETGATLGELVPDETDAFERIDRLQTLVPVITALTPRERAILVMRFVRGCTQAEIGAELGVSQMQVSRLLRDLLERLREALASPAGEDEDALVID